MTNEMITQIMKLKGEIEGLVTNEGQTLITEADWAYVARCAAGETRGNSVRTHGIWQNAIYLANFGTTPQA